VLENSLARGATGVVVQWAWQRHVNLFPSFVVKDKIFSLYFRVCFLSVETFLLLLLRLSTGAE